MKGRKILISVCMITYNHELFIEEAIKGVLDQIVDFGIELVISDDRSSDGTSDIINKVIKSHKNGDWVKYHQQAENKGIIPNFVWTLKACSGEFIAICEGDDYWIDNLKLKRQLKEVVDNSELAGCFHLAKVKYEGKPYLDGIFKVNVPDLLYTEDLIATSSSIHTATILFRKEALVFPDWYEKTLSGDFALTSIISSYGPLKKIPEIMSVYRVHQGGITNSAYYSGNILDFKIEVLNKLNEFHRFKFDAKFQLVIDELRKLKNRKKIPLWIRLRKKVKLGILKKKIIFKLREFAN